MNDFLNAFGLVIPYISAFSIPLLIVALGGLLSERSGVVNIGLEGFMVMGTFFCALVMATLTSVPLSIRFVLALCASFLGSDIFAILHAIASIKLKANQVISGTAINMLAMALTTFFAHAIAGSGRIDVTTALPTITDPVLKDIPVLGPLFFTRGYVTSYLVLLILALVAIYLRATPGGLRLNAAGEHPHALASTGRSVERIRYGAVLVSGAFGGLGGGILVLTTSQEFSGSVNGLGFLALAALIFGKWKPIGILLACFFFGFFLKLNNYMLVDANIRSTIPPVFIKIFPYVLTLLVMMIFARRSAAPKALGVEFDLGKR